MAESKELLPRLSKGYPRYLGFFRSVVKVVLQRFAVMKSEGERTVPATGGVIILCNHLSNFDPILVQHFCPRPIRYMAKHDFFKVPVMGFLMRLMGAFPVKRGEPDREALRIAQFVLERGEVLGVFPEAELSKTGELLPLKPGFALLVRTTGAPVICCGIKGSNGMMPYGRALPRPSAVPMQLRWGEIKRFDKKSSTQEIVSWVELELRRLTDQASD
jgi:1-acyl-sn-glycerol-3-phosphate acyltransferase